MSNTSLISLVLLGAALVFKDDIVKMIKGDHSKDKKTAGSSEQKGPYCPSCASKRAGRPAVWRDTCADCGGPCATVPDNKQIIDQLMQQIFGTNTQSQQEPSVYDVINDPGQGPINLNELEGARPSMMTQGNNEAPQYTCGPRRAPVQQPAQQQQLTNSGGFGTPQGQIGGVPAPSTLPAMEGDVLPLANYGGMI